MNIKRTMLFLIACVSFSATAQTFDNTGNGKLSGNYYFREVAFTSTDEYAAYGTISFSSGTYTLNATVLDCNSQSGCSGGGFSPSGTYSISASGFGFLSNQLLGGSIYGAVGANGVFIGSSTEGGSYDLFIAAPVTSQSTSTLNGAYNLAYIDPTGYVTNGTPFDAQVQFTANGSGSIGTVNISAYATTSTPTTQQISGIKYNVSSSAFVLTFPSSSSSQNLIQGQEYLYSTPDGSFVFGGSPQNFDMIVGVRTQTGSGLGSGLYYQAGLDINDSSGNGDTYYGAFTALSSGAIVGHERLQYGGASGSGFTYEDSYQPGSNSYTDTYTNTQFTIGSGGVRIGLGIGPALGIAVAVAAPSVSGSGVYIYPTGVENAASFAPFTAGVSPGEMITIFGTNLGPSTLQSATTVPLPTKIAGVQVLVNNLPAPLVYVSANQISAIVPWEVGTSIAQIQVVSNGTNSNVVTEFVNPTTPGVFAGQYGSPAGIGYAAAEHANGSVVTPANPAQVGETIAVFLTGLGNVFPSVLDGTPGVSSSTSVPVTADVGGVAAAVTYAGLAPGEVGLYQVNLQIPSGVTNGDNALDIGATDGSSYTTEALITVTGGVAPAVVPAARPSLQRPGTTNHFHHFARPRVPSTLQD